MNKDEKFWKECKKCGWINDINNLKCDKYGSDFEEQERKTKKVNKITSLILLGVILTAAALFILLLMFAPNIFDNILKK